MRFGLIALVLSVELRSPAPDQAIEPGTILVAVGDSESIERLSRLTHPFTGDGPIIVIGFGDVGHRVGEILTEAGDKVRAIDKSDRPGVDLIPSPFVSGLVARDCTSAPRRG